MVITAIKNCGLIVILRRSRRISFLRCFTSFSMTLCVILHFTFYIFNCPLYSYTRLGLNNSGDVVSGFSARSVGMGSTGITTINDASALAVNPATMAVGITANKMILAVTPSYSLFEEKENFFDVTNDNVYFQLTGAGIAVPVVRNILVFGVNNSPVLDYSYKYSYTMLSSLMQKILDTGIIASGGLRKTDIGFGLKIVDELHLGFSYGLIGGEAKRESESTFYSSNLPIFQSDTALSTNYDGSSARYGLVFNRLNYTFGGFYQSPSTVKYDITETETDSDLTTGVSIVTKTVSKGDIKYPESFGFGFSYKFKGKFRTLFAVDWERQNWNILTYRTKTIDDVATGAQREHIYGYKETDELKLGLEMWLNDWIPVRCGFRYQEFYESWDNRVYNWYHSSYITKNVVPVFYGFSFGSGYVLEKFDIDFGYEFARRSYEKSSDRYDEDLQRFVVTTRFRW
ncbi:MAG: hypothetical protein Q7K21_08395 [Elusimicrobiota bacterium]|nr:hypothetical protein [Elusimicrobiota bacterium]